jgi:hypothetical protein
MQPALCLLLFDFAGWSEKGAAVDAAVAGSEDQPGKKFPSCAFRVPSFEFRVGWNSI